MCLEPLVGACAFSARHSAGLREYLLADLFENSAQPLPCMKLPSLQATSSFQTGYLRCQTKVLGPVPNADRSGHSGPSQPSPSVSPWCRGSWWRVPQESDRSGVLTDWAGCLISEPCCPMFMKIMTVPPLTGLWEAA